MKGSCARGARCAFKHDDPKSRHAKGDNGQRAPSPTKDSVLPNQKSVTRQAHARQEKKVDLFVTVARKVTVSKTRNATSGIPLSASFIQAKPDKKVSFMIAQSEGTSVPKVKLERHKTTGPKHSVQWSAHDMTVAFFQNARVSRNVIQKGVWHERNPMSLFPFFRDAER